MNNFIPETPQIKIVNSFVELIETKFQGENNAIAWQRNLEGDFQEIVSKLVLKYAITEVSKDDLLALQLSDDGNLAREIILKDFDLLTKSGAQPSLNLLQAYERDVEFDFISTDVYSFHVDRSPLETSTFLCTYFGAASDIIPNHQAIQKIHIPEIREKLKLLNDDPDEDFETFLAENYFNLHYQALPNSEPINLGIGNLWKLTVEHPNQKVLPCVHRAPIENNELRLLLIC